MTTLYALCYPTFTDGDRQFIDDLRRENDIAFRDIVAPHFTMLFACDAVPELAYREHVCGVARSQAAIGFSCRYAMVCNDASNDNYYAFLVPDHGFSEISRLHDRLYRGVMAPHLRLDIPYVPHVAVATDTDGKKIKALCDRLNADGVVIDGRLETITICAFRGATIADLETLRFRE